MALHQFNGVQVNEGWSNGDMEIGFIKLGAQCRHK